MPRVIISPAESRHGGARVGNFAGNDQYVTAVVITSAAGHCLPPFFVFVGKYKIKEWLDSLDKSYFDDDESEGWLAEPEWFPKDARMSGTANGSMKISIIHLVIEHIQTHYRNIFPPERQLCLVLDDHSSRNGLEWLERAKKYIITEKQSPKNTIYFL